MTNELWMSKKKVRHLQKSRSGSLRREPFELPEGCFEPAGALLDALGAAGALRGCSGDLPGTLWGLSGGSRGTLGTLRGHPWDP